MNRIAATRKGITILAVMIVSLVASADAWAKWLPVHQIASDRPLYVADPDLGAWDYAKYGFSSSNWQESTPQAFSHALGSAFGNLYEFRLIKVASSDASKIEGSWNVYRNGVVVCGGCIGRAYGLNGAVGDYFKIYVGTPVAYAERWHFSAYITHRFDY